MVLRPCFGLGCPQDRGRFLGIAARVGQGLKCSAPAISARNSLSSPSFLSLVATFSRNLLVQAFWVIAWSEESVAVGSAPQ